MVAGQNHYVIRVVPVDVVHILIDGVRGAFIPVGPPAALIGRQHLYAAVHAVQIPGLSVSDILIEH